MPRKRNQMRHQNVWRLVLQQLPDAPWQSLQLELLPALPIEKLRPNLSMQKYHLQARIAL